MLAAFALALLPSPVLGESTYIEGLSIQLEDYPCEVRVGETFTMTVKVVNQSEQQVDALLRTYLYSDTSLIVYPRATFGDIVLVSEGDWYTNEISVNVGPNENETYTLRLTVKSEIQLADEEGVWARLRARIRRVENDATINIAPPDNRDITLLPKPGPEGIFGIKLGVGLAVAAAIIYSVVAIQTHNNRGARKHAQK